MSASSAISHCRASAFIVSSCSTTLSAAKCFWPFAAVKQHRVSFSRRRKGTEASNVITICTWPSPRGPPLYNPYRIMSDWTSSMGVSTRPCNERLPGLPSQSGHPCSLIETSWTRKLSSIFFAGGVFRSSRHSWHQGLAVTSPASLCACRSNSLQAHLRRTSRTCLCA